MKRRPLIHKRGKFVMTQALYDQTCREGTTAVAIKLGTSRSTLEQHMRRWFAQKERKA